MYLMRSILFLLTASIMLIAAPTRLVGVVLEAGSDRPVADVNILYMSGKKISSTDARGRFDIEVTSENTVLLVKKEGYDSLTVNVSEFPDFLDMVILVSTNVRDLGQSTVIGGENIVEWENVRHVELDKLEDAAGMRFDLTEHLSQMSGISGQKDFSSALFYDGSRAEEVIYHLGRLRVPNMRHLDVGFPGNLSVINPRVLNGIEAHDHYGSGPISQGLAASIQYLPAPVEGEDFGAKLSLGVTLQEIVVEGPFLFWDGFRFAFRRLDEAMLKNMGEKFFTEFKKRDSGSDEVVKSSDPFNLSAYDFFAALSGSDSLGNNWGLHLLYSTDKYIIRQDTSTLMSEVNSIDIIKGSQNYLVLGLDYNSKWGLSWNAGFVRQSLSDTLRDTTGFRANSVAESASFIDGFNFVQTTISVGAEKPFQGHILGSDLSTSLLFEHQIIEREYPDFNAVQKMKESGNILTGASRMRWLSQKQNMVLALGALADFSGHASPIASFDLERKLFSEEKSPWRLFGNAAWRADWTPVYQENDIDGILVKGASAKLGVGYRSKYLDVQTHGFGRYYVNPVLPQPKAYAHYTEQTDVDFAWVYGVQAKAEWKTSHHFSMGTNISSVYGEYELAGDRSLPWQANSRLDMVSHFRFYPRKDSLFSFILSHHVAWHRPLYYYKITPSAIEGGEEVYGTRRVDDIEDFTDLFRTDLRVNLDLPGKRAFFRNVRFYIEANNILANLDVPALRFLGGENARERSVVTQDNDSNHLNGYEIVPFMAKGMGLFVQFGVEGTFSI